MLGSRTRQVNSYGKRSVRVIPDDSYRPARQPSIFDDLTPPWKPVASRMKKRENDIPKKSKSTSPRAVGQQKTKLSPIRVQVAKKMARAAQVADAQTPVKKLGRSRLSDTPVRTPLAAYHANIPASPAVLKPPISIKPAATKPLVQLEIITISSDGQTLKKEKRVSQPKNSSISLNPSPSSEDAQPQRRKRLMRRAEVKRVVSDDESDADSVSSYVASQPSPQPKPSPKKRAQPKRVVSDDSDSDDTPVPVKQPPPRTVSIDDAFPPVKSMPLPTAAPTKPRKRPSTPEQPPIPVRYQHLDSPIFKTRQLTPIRGRKPLFQPASPPSPTTPSDLSFDFDQLDLEEGSDSFHAPPEVPEYLRPLLEECHQDTCGIHEFSSFINTFPYDSAVRSHGGQDLQFRKIGEASYSEVFGIGDVVLKVIPLRDETVSSATQKLKAAEVVDEPFSTDAKDVLKELIVTRALGQVCDGFVELLKAYIVRGRYPEVLLELWDEYYQRKGSENIRPDTFTLSQVYCIIVLPNGGPDLEAFSFSSPSKIGWRQACSIFWQVTKALAHAEKLVSFEHRDLHLGQILVKTHPIPTTKPLQVVSQNQPAPSTKPRKLKMDDSAHGVSVTLIDLGLARMDAGDGSGGEMIHWTPFDKEIFMGEGDYQFDIYRMMRAYNGGKWVEFNPTTNVMWLHYLLVKLLGFKDLKTPRNPNAKKAQAAPTASSSTIYTERECYECLIDLEDWLGKCLAAIVPAELPTAKSKGKKKASAQTQAQPSGSVSPLCAGEVVEYGVKKRWVKAIS